MTESYAIQTDQDLWIIPFVHDINGSVLKDQLANVFAFHVLNEVHEECHREIADL